jgi:hypothetical protein
MNFKHLKTFENFNLSESKSYDPDTYYVEWSAYFNDPTNKYDIDKIKEAIKKANGERIRTANQFGWSNQPKVVVFKTDEDNLKNIQKAVQDAIGTEHIIISNKDW